MHKVPAIHPKSKQHPAWMNKMFSIVFGLGGLGLLVFGSKQLRDGFASKRWPTTEGIVTESKLEQQNTRRKTFRPHVSYSFTVGNEHFISDRILFGMSSYSSILKSDRQRSEDWLEMYPIGKTVKVAYNPSEPGESTLNAGAHYTAWILPMLGAVFFLVGVFQFYPSKKLDRK